MERKFPPEKPTERQVVAWMEWVIQPLLGRLADIELGTSDQPGPVTTYLAPIAVPLFQQMVRYTDDEMVDALMQYASALESRGDVMKAAQHLSSCLEYWRNHWCDEHGLPCIVRSDG